MSTQNRSSGGSRTQKKSNSIVNSGGGGGDSVVISIKKTDGNKIEKEKPQAKQPTAEQIRIAQITNSNSSEDPKMREKVATLIEMTQRSEEEVCCALYECDNNLERAVVFLLETLPVGAFETSSKKKKNRTANTGQENVGENEWTDSNANTERREKSRNRSSNRGGRGGADSRGWRAREDRENERNSQDSANRGSGGYGGGRDRAERSDRGDRDGNYRGSGGRGRGGSRGGGYVGRGGRGGRIGQRGGSGRDYQGRNNYSSRQQDDHQEVELWDNTIAQNAEKQQQQSQDDAWGDWDNEEYVGSLKDSKVFTPSNLQNQSSTSTVGGIGGVGNNSEMAAPPGLEHHLTSQSSNIGSGADESSSSVVLQYSTVTNANASPGGNVSIPGLGTPVPAVGVGTIVGNVTSSSSVGLSSSQFSDIHPVPASVSNSVQNIGLPVSGTPGIIESQQQQMKSSATLSAEQSQYFNSLSSQNAAAAAAAAAAASAQQQAQVAGSSVQQQQASAIVNSYQNSSVQYPVSYATVFGDQSSAAQPSIRRTRAKVPPPSKIPSTAVEMPGDTLNNIGYLDVQFGGLDFGTEDSFDALPEKFNTSTSIDNQQHQAQQIVQSQDLSSDYQGKSNASVQQQQQSTGLAAGLQTSQIADSLTSGGYSQRSSTSIVQQQQQQVSNVGVGSSGSSGTSLNNAANSLDQLTKNDPYNQSNAASSGYQSSYNTGSSGASKSATAVYQSTANQGYSSASYGNVQSSSVANTYQPSSNAYNSYNQSSVNSYQNQQANSVSANSSVNSVSGSTVNTGVSGNSTQNIPVGGSSSTSVNNASASSNAAGYLSSQYQSNQTSSAYPSQQSAYQNSQSVYGSTGLSNNSGFAGSTSTSSSQYSNFSSAKLKDTSTTSNSSHFESVSSVASSSSVSSTTANSVSSSTATTNSMSSPSLGLTNTKVTNSTAKNSTGMVPNIQMVSQYIQTGLPYYQQPVYSYEDIQMMQQRVPHVQGYYDLNYTPTSLGAGRDNLGSVAYSTMTDGRFARTDNNSSPVSNVSSTMSQQAGSSGPMLNVPYAYAFYGGNMMPGSFQYGTPAIYPQQIPAANTASGGQFPKPSYNTGYGSTSYDTLSQASQDYSKGAYPSSVNQQAKSQNVTNPPQAGTGSDISSSMYGKGHVALNKVNSYEKQNFHSGTPPPFNMPNTQTAGTTSAQPYGMYLQPMPAGGHHNMIHQPIHQDSNSSGQRQQPSSQTKSSTKQGYSPSYWTGQN